MAVAPASKADADPARLGHLNLIEASREATRWGVGGALAESDGIVLFATGSALPVSCNGAFRADDAASPTELITRADAFFGARRRGYAVMVRDLPVDDDLRHACRQAGLSTFGAPAPEMICSAPVPLSVPPGVALRPLTTVDDVAAFAAVTGAAYATYGMPVETAADYLSLPQRLLDAPNVLGLLAHDGTEALAGALAVLSHGVGGLYWVGTVEKARRSGLGRAVTAAVTNAAFARGAAVVGLQASAMGEPLYRSLGYETVYHYEDFVRLRAPRP